jgi:peptidoglycan-N-acetylglucosamine deacetylase
MGNEEKIQGGIGGHDTVRPIFFENTGKRWKIFFVLGILFVLVFSFIAFFSYKNYFTTTQFDKKIKALTEAQLNVPIKNNRDITVFWSGNSQAYFSLTQNYDRIGKIIVPVLSIYIDKDNQTVVKLDKDKLVEINDAIGWRKDNPIIIPMIALHNLEDESVSNDLIIKNSTVLSAELGIKAALELLTDNSNLLSFEEVIIESKLSKDNTNSYKAFETSLVSSLNKNTSISTIVNYNSTLDEYKDNSYKNTYINIDTSQVKDTLTETAYVISKLKESIKNTIFVINSKFEDVSVASLDSTPRTFQETINILQNYKPKIILDNKGINTEYLYKTDDGSRKLSLFDAVNMYNLVSLSRAQGVNLSEFAIGNVGREDPASWYSIREQSIVDVTRLISEKSPLSYRLEQLGNSVFLNDIQFNYGKRKVVVNNNEISAEWLLFPKQATISTGFENSNKIALTFDDGPDPVYTPKILDILKEKNVKATFFLIGSNVREYPELVNRIIAEGHDIGNHTFTHNHFDESVSELNVAQIDATDVSIRQATGYRSLTFRTPYNARVDLSTIAEGENYKDVINNGYTIVGQDIDPQDWNNKTEDQLIKRVNDLTNYKDNIINSHVVLLHDSGGDRESTIKALPNIIDSLKNKGRDIVSVSAMMPGGKNAIFRIDESDIFHTAFFTSTINMISNLGNKFARNVADASTILLLVKFFFMLTLLSTRNILMRRMKFDPSFKPRVTAIVSGYNEESVLERTINSLLEQDYPNLDIIFVDDGSKDNTLEVANHLYSGNSRVTILTKTNGGKASGLNFGLAYTTSEYYVSLDADTILLTDAVSKMIRHFEDPRVGAVAGKVDIGNEINIVTRLQSVEYITGQNIDKSVYEMLGTVLVVPGAIGAWRTQLVRDIGGYSPQTLAEDLDLTVTLLQTKSRVVYEPRAIAITEAPEDYKTLSKQRFRWTYGTYQVMLKHRSLFFSVRNNFLGLFAFPMLFLQFAFIILSPFVAIVNLPLLIDYIYGIIFPGQRLFGFELSQNLFLTSFVIFLIIEYFNSILAIFIEKKWSRLALLPFVPIQKIVFNYFMYYIAMKSLLQAIKGNKVGWNKFKRSGAILSSASAK